jgi:hypothetical protein
MHDTDIVIRISRRQLKWIVTVAVLMAVLVILSPARAQKVQEVYDDKFKKKGIIVSDDHGKTGTWVQTVRLK